MSSVRLPAIARMLVDEQILDHEQVLEILRRSRAKGRSFLDLATSEMAIDSQTVAEKASERFQLPLADLDEYDLNKLPVDNITHDAMRRYSALPLSEGDSSIRIALSDPSDMTAIDHLRFQLKKKVIPVLVAQTKLSRAIETVSQKNLANIDDATLDQLWVETTGEDDEDDDDAGSDSVPVIRLINRVILEAVQAEASDIHFEPYEDAYRVRTRLDGVLKEVASPAPTMGRRIAARIKVMARLDTSERRVPQDGRIKLNMGNGRMMDFRVSTCPTLHGEKLVMRLLDPSTAQMGIQALGYEPEQRRIFESTIRRPNGMVLVTGPTGSGKTVSLYTALNLLNREGVNISTAEDPAEINLSGINQVNVKPRVGLDFAACLRAFLRQDPDVIMVGEIRDLETAEIAIKAAQTGHMVLSTVHTNNAPSTLTRLVNMGVPGYNIADSVSLIIAQRLARRLCAFCKIPAELSDVELASAGLTSDEDAHRTIYNANERGCEHCNAGFKGRVGIYEVMPVSDSIGDLIMDGGNARDIERQARKDGVIDLFNAGLNKVREGVVSLSEVHRVTVE